MSGAGDWDEPAAAPDAEPAPPAPPAPAAPDAEPAASGPGDWDESAADPEPSEAVVTGPAPVAAEATPDHTPDPTPAPTPEQGSGTPEFGPGSAADEDGAAPAGHPIKGNTDSMLFHTPESPAYERTQAGVWFQDESSALAAGFDSWDAHRKR